MESHLPDHYRLLGVPPHADAAAIKNSYRRLSRVFHPDRQQGSARAKDCFQQIAAAYAELADAERRLQYDRLLMLRDPLRLVDDPRAERALDVLDQVVSRLRKKAPALPSTARGRDLRVQQRVEFHTAALGGTVVVQAEYDTACATCLGQGSTEPERNPVCHVCLGHGELRVGIRRQALSCGFCLGRGSILLAPCAPCGGRGQVRTSQAVDVRVPPRCREGSHLRVRAAGERPALGGSPGDLVVVVQIAAHPLLRMDGDDLLCTVPLTWAQAVAGTRLWVPTLEGPELLTVPPLTPTGREFRIAGRGLPIGDAAAARRGNLRLQIAIDLPEVAGHAQIEAVRALEHLLGVDAFSRVVAFGREVESLRIKTASQGPGDAGR